MKLAGRAFIHGILLPIRMYFHPLTVLREAVDPNTTDPPRPSMGLVYVFSLLWVPIGIIIGLYFFGVPRENTFGMLIAIPGLLILMGAWMGRSAMQVRRDGKLVKKVFNYPLPVAFSVGFGLTALFNAFVLEMLSKQYGIGIAEVVDSRSLDAPASMILGVGMALTLNLVLGSIQGPRKIVLYGNLLAFTLLAMTLLSGSLSTDSLATSIPIFLLIGHLGLQPFYFLIYLTSLVLARLSPNLGPVFWRLSPVSWCEYFYMPTPGLAWFLRTLYHTNTAAGVQALGCVRLHPFYHRTAEKVAKELGTTENLPL